MNTNHSRKQHLSQVISYLQKHLRNQTWEIDLPRYGTGQETYLARDAKQVYFIKLGAIIERYQVMGDLGLSPRLVTAGHLEDGTTILVQEYVSGRKPSWGDFQRNWIVFAESIRLTHQSQDLQRILPKRPSQNHRDVGFEILAEIESRWQRVKIQVPGSAPFIDQQIEYLKDQIGLFSEQGLVASHNDVCNGNWLVAADGTIYLLDYESMSLDDPALDLGAILWWYYPPHMRDEFLTAAGYRYDAGFRERMRIRMAVHNLNIIVPRQNSFDRFLAEGFEDALVDFRAVISGRENPQGYEDRA